MHGGSKNTMLGRLVSLLFLLPFEVVMMLIFKQNAVGITIDKKDVEQEVWEQKTVHVSVCI